MSSKILGLDLLHGKVNSLVLDVHRIALQKKRRDHLKDLSSEVCKHSLLMKNLQYVHACLHRLRRRCHDVRNSTSTSCSCGFQDREVDVARSLHLFPAMM